MTEKGTSTQHRFGNSGAEVQNSTLVILLNFCAKFG